MVVAHLLHDLRDAFGQEREVTVNHVKSFEVILQHLKRSLVDAWQVHKQLEGFDVPVHSLGIALCELEVVILHDDVGVALADHRWNVGQVMSILMVDGQHILHNLELVVLV